MEKNPRPGLRGDCTRKLFTIFVILTVTVLYSSFSRPVSSAAINPPAGMPAYKNPSFTIDKRVEDLLSRMTLEEKIGQMNMPCVYMNSIGRDIPEKIETVKKMAEGVFMENIGPLGGFFTLGNNILFDETRKQAEFFNELQKIAVESTRLGIPLLQTEEGTHGLMIPGGTIFPEGPALGSTWNLELLRDIYSTVAMEARAVGLHQLYTFVIEPIRDPRLGRNQESYSEDPYYLSQIARVIVEAVQGDDISAKDKTVAGLAHFPGQSEPVSGMERGAMEISERKLREVYLPPWIAGIRESGALGVMATYPSIDGIPTHASEFLLTDVLRNELNYQGPVLGEGGGLETILYEGLAATPKEAGVLAIKAGLDVGISWEEPYLGPLYENVMEGNVSMDLIDRAVRRVLRIKFMLGLFEDPYVDPAYAEQVMHTGESQDLSLEAARQGIVLLRNENNLLPLQKNNIRNIAVIGPNADHALNQLGDYTTRSVRQEITTVLDGIRNMVPPGVNVHYVEGTRVIGDDINEIHKAVEAAKGSDIAIVVLGENEWQTAGNKGTSGEGYDVANLELTGLQEELLKAVHETGTPTILVLINGRPLAIPWAAENIPAIVEAWIPGEKGGTAIAEVIFGEYNPSGKLPVTFPRHSGQIPVYYNYMPSKQYWIDHHWGAAYADMPATPLYEFGYGLSYTTYEYTNLSISPKETGLYGTVTVSVDVKNTGSMKGTEVAQLYIRDVISSVTRPVKELKGFSRVTLEPGEIKTVEFTLDFNHLAFFNRHMEWVVEPGTFRVMVGSSSEDIRLTGEFEMKPVQSGKDGEKLYYDRNL
jgi:beta-glucosidase